MRFKIKLKGFTLIEVLCITVLMIGLSIIGIATYSNFIQKNEQETILDDLKSIIQFAKMQSIIIGSPVYLSPLDTKLNWINGIKLTTLNKRTNSRIVIYQWQWNHPQWNLNWIGATSANNIQFSNNCAQAISNGKFLLTNVNTHKKVEIILNRLGRVRVASSAY